MKFFVALRCLSFSSRVYLSCFLSHSPAAPSASPGADIGAVQLFSRDALIFLCSRKSSRKKAEVPPPRLNVRPFMTINLL
jgi:hypothetical protein